MRAFLLLLLLACPNIYGQKLNAWLVKDIDENPQAYLAKAAKQMPSTPIEAAGKFYALGKCYHNLNQEDIALKYYLLSKKEFELLKLEEPSKDLALEIHRVISSQENYDKYGNIFLDEYYEYAKKTGSKQRQAYAWNEFAKNAYAEFDFEKRSNPKVLDSAAALFNKGLEFAAQTNDASAKAKLYSNLGVLENTRHNFAAARNYIDKAREFIIVSGDRYELFANYFNYGNTYFTEENDAQAIVWLQKAEKVKIPKFRDKTTRVLYKKLMESFDAINDQPNRRKYQKLYLDLDNRIKDEDQNIAIHDINVKYQVAQKDVQISSLHEFKDKFYKNRLVFGILLFLVFLLALYSFVRWKKIDHRKKRLEEEKLKMQEEKYEIEEIHSKTVEELEKVKNIVTEGSITLKDKTKLYLNDLMYIKAEDHYLHAFVNDGKNHLVRGKLSQILLELPPNFAKCHRSYIVNTNYIQSVHQGFVILKNKDEIPVSRGFKL
jgi:hypothetical protein